MPELDTRPLHVGDQSRPGQAQTGGGANAATDHTFRLLKNLKDVRAYTQLPVLGSIPLLENDLIVRRGRRLAWLAWSTACLVGVIIMSSSVVYYFATKL